MQTENSRLQQTIKNLIKGKSDIALFGPKCCGKTTLATKLLDNVLGRNNYIKLNMLILDRPSQFMREVSYQIFRFVKRLDPDMIHNYQHAPSQAQISIKYSNIIVWIQQFNHFMKKYKQSFNKINSIYIFIDNIQQCVFTSQYMSAFYKVMKRKLRYMTASFFFCGLNYRQAITAIKQPLRYLPFFVMKKLNISEIIENTIAQTEFNKKLNKLRSKLIQLKIKNRELCGNQDQSPMNRQQHFTPRQIESKKQFQKCQHKFRQYQQLFQHMRSVLCNTFGQIQTNISRIKLITQCYVDYIEQYVNNQGIKAKLWLETCQQQQKKLLQKLLQNGPIVLTRLKEQLSEQNQQQLQQYQIQPTLQNYPNLILASLKLANNFRESKDAIMYLFSKKTISKNKVNENKINNMRNYSLNQDTYRARVISISEIIEEQTQSNIFNQKELQVHTLDFYGCFQYLKEQGYINIIEDKFDGKIHNNKLRQDQLDRFLQRTNIIHPCLLGQN